MVRILKDLADTAFIPPKPNPLDVAGLNGLICHMCYDSVNGECDACRMARTNGPAAPAKKPPIPTRKFLLDTIIPASPVLVLEATIHTTHDRHQLRIRYTTRGTLFDDCILGDSLYELTQRLTAHLGFNLQDAFKIITLATRLL